MSGLNEFFRKVPDVITDALRDRLGVVREAEVLAQLQVGVWTSYAKVFCGVVSDREKTGKSVPAGSRAKILSILEDGDHVEAQSLGSLEGEEADLPVEAPSGSKLFIDDHVYRLLH